MSSLEILNSWATFSLVHPMGCRASAAGLHALISSLAASGPASGLTRKLARDKFIARYLVTHFHDIHSTPTANLTSICPARISLAIVVVARRPEEQKRLTV